jgi:hypothetical protein
MHQASSFRDVRALRGVAAWSVAAGLALSPVAALADEAPSGVLAFGEEGPNLLNDSFYVALGTFILNSDTEVSLNGEAQQGSIVDWERNFGDDDMTRVRLDGYWRFGDSQRHKIRGLWFSTSRDSSRTIERDIEWGDVTYPASISLKGESSFDIYELAYEYAFLRRDNYEVTGTAGLHYTEISLALSGAGEINGQPVQGGVKKEGSVGAPLPVIGLRGLWDLSHNFWIDASAQFFSMSFEEFDGNLQDYRLAVVWQPKKWVGVGLGYNRFKVDVDITKDRFDGNLNWSYDGPMIFYSASF